MAKPETYAQWRKRILAFKAKMQPRRLPRRRAHRGGANA